MLCEPFHPNVTEQLQLSDWLLCVDKLPDDQDHNQTGTTTGANAGQVKAMKSTSRKPGDIPSITARIFPEETQTKNKLT